MAAPARLATRSAPRAPAHQATLIAALDKYDLKRGVAGLCIGGGEATAMAVERVR